ncbi:MAG: hypothetical protein ACYDC6_00955 [Acidobacteriaceae bacterium]
MPEKMHLNPKGTIRSLLAGGDRRSIGRANEVAERVLRQPEEFARLIECLWDRDPLISMRAADAAEKASRAHPEMLQPYKGELLGLLGETIQKELRWHLAVMVPRLLLDVGERHRAIESLKSYMEDRSSIVKTLAMQGLAEMASRDVAVRSEVTDLIRFHTRTGTPAMRARGRKLLARLLPDRP